MGQVHYYICARTWIACRRGFDEMRSTSSGHGLALRPRPQSPSTMGELKLFMPDAVTDAAADELGRQLER